MSFNNEKLNSLKSLDKKEDNVERLPETQEKMKEIKTPKEEIEEIEIDIAKTEDLLGKEEKEIAEKRVSLGLLEVDKNNESASAKDLKEKIKTLSERKKDLEKSVGIENKKQAEEENKLEKEETKIEKIKEREFGDFIAEVKKMATHLRERDSQKLNQLTENPEKINGAVAELDASLISHNPDTEGVGRAIGRIAEFIGELGEKKQASLREDPKSLSKLAFYLRNINEKGHILGGRISKKENAFDILPALSRIESTTQRKMAGIKQKIDLLRQIGGRR